MRRKKDEKAIKNEWIGVRLQMTSIKNWIFGIAVPILLF